MRKGSLGGSTAAQDGSCRVRPQLLALLNGERSGHISWVL